MKNNPKIRFCHPYEDTFCCTGEAIKRDNIDVFYNGKQVCNKEGEVYYIFHQWDRTEVSKLIRDQDAMTLKFSL